MRKVRIEVTKEAYDHPDRSLIVISKNICGVVFEEEKGNSHVFFVFM